MQVAASLRTLSISARSSAATRHVVHQHKLQFVNGHLTDPYLVVRLRAPVPSLPPGSWFSAASNAVLHASLRSAFLSLRQVVIASGSGMNALQSLNASGMHAVRGASVPCEKEGVGETVADNRTSNMHHCAKGIGRSIQLTWLSMFIIRLVSTIGIDTRHRRLAE